MRVCLDLELDAATNALAARGMLCIKTVQRATGFVDHHMHRLVDRASSKTRHWTCARNIASKHEAALLSG